MKKTLVGFSLSVFVVLFWIAPAVGQDNRAVAPESIVSELAHIQQSLEDLVDLMSASRRYEDADLILRRIEMHERRMAPVERQIERNQREHVDAQTNLGWMEKRVSQTEKRVRKIEREGIQVSDELFGQVTGAIQAVEREKARIEALKLQRIELENGIAGKRDEVKVLEDSLRELLD